MKKWRGQSAAGEIRLQRSGYLMSCPASLCRGVAAALVLGLSGCASVGPEFSAPEADFAANWLEANNAGISTGTGEFDNWWDVFGDQTLNSLPFITKKQQAIRGPAVEQLFERHCFMHCRHA